MAAASTRRGLQRVLDAPKAPGHGRNPASREANEVELGVVNDDAYHDLDQGPFGTGAADSTAVDRALAWERCAQPDRHNALSDPEGVIGACSATQDMGNGSRTALATTVAQAFGLSPDEIDVRIGDSRLPPGPLSGGSRSTATLVPAALLVADRLKAELRRQSNRGSWFYFWQPGCGVELSVRNGRLIGRGPDATPEAPIGMRSQRALRGVRRATAPASRLWSRSWVATASCAFPARKSPHLRPLTGGPRLRRSPRSCSARRAAVITPARIVASPVCLSLSTANARRVSAVPGRFDALVLTRRNPRADRPSV